MRRSLFIPVPLASALMGFVSVRPGMANGAETTDKLTETTAISRETFPVPSVIASLYGSGGLAAFDPFHTWAPGSSRPPDPANTADPGADAARLPDGPFYDVSAAWTAHGFQPHAGTRVLYSPKARRLFASISPQDREQVRAFCTWPAEIWIDENAWLGSPPVRQAKYCVSVWLVPAVGTGGWTFRPQLPDGLLALPASARRQVARQSVIDRAGQRAMVESVSGLLPARDQPGTGLTTEVEMTLAEDGATHDFNTATALRIRLESGELVALNNSYQQISSRGGEWLVEAGLLPGNPPQRVFLLCGSVPVGDPALRRGGEDAMVTRWTGKPVEVGDNPGGWDAAFLDVHWSGVKAEAVSEARLRFEIPEPKVSPDPFAPSHSRDRTAPFADYDNDVYDPATDPALGPLFRTLPPWPLATYPAQTLPEIFGRLKVRDVTSFVSYWLNLNPAAFRVWIPENTDGQLFVAGEPEVLQILKDRFPPWYEMPNRLLNPSLELTLTESRGPDSPLITHWHSNVPVREGQQSHIAFETLGWDAKDHQEVRSPGAGLHFSLMRTSRLDAKTAAAAPLEYPADDSLTVDASFEFHSLVSNQEISWKGRLEFTNHTAPAQTVILNPGTSGQEWKLTLQLHPLPPLVNEFPGFNRLSNWWRKKAPLAQKLQREKPASSN